MLLALLYPMLLGLERLDSTYLLTRNGVFQTLTGLPTYPNATTLRRFLLRLGRAGLPKLRRFHDRLRARIVAAEGRRRFVFDVDSTVVVVYGQQEQARRGYNPTKRGRRSYHPLVCFEGLSRDYWAGELRPGDAHTAVGTVELLARCFAQLPPAARRVDVRGDKGFYDGKIVAALEDRRAGFVLVARLTQPIRRRLSGLQYTPHRGRVETAEFWYQPHGWPGPYRFVVIRRPLEEEPSAQLTLFTVQRHTYQVLVTNLDLQPINLWRFYKRPGSARADHPRARGGLPAGPGAEETLLCERGVLSSPPVRLQPDAMVQALLLAGGLARDDVGYPALAPPPDARPVRSHGAPAEHYGSRRRSLTRTRGNMR